MMSKKLTQQMKKTETKVQPHVLVQLSDADVAPEISYWKTAIYESLQSEQLMFDNKPVFIHEWSADTELVKHEVTAVPIWIKLVGLELKFWGENALKKISGIIGEYIRCDDATVHKTLLSYAKILVKVKIDQKFPTAVEFMDEKGKVQTLKVEYDWLPLKCSQCKGMGHLAANCRKPDDKVQPAKPDGKEKNLNGKKPAVTTPKVMRNSITPTRILTRMKSQEFVADSIPGKSTFIEVFNSAVQKSVQMAKGGLSSGRLRLERRFKEDASSRVDNGYYRILEHKGKHKGGRIWFLWNPQGFDVNIEDITSQTIHAYVKDKINGRAFWFTCVYGFNDLGMRSALWDSLKSYSHHCAEAWAIGGDFNNVLTYLERIGAEVSLAEIQPFQDCIEYCQVQDIKAIGSFFTWNNKQGATTRKYSRLDSFLVNEEWLSVYPDAYANFMPERIFDHCPCVVQFGKTVQRKKVPFKYYNMWSLATDYSQIVETAWSEQVDGTPIYQLASKLKKLKMPLKCLNKNNFSDIENTASITLWLCSRYIRT
ncbi:uncharacterized protein LOC141648843 [Silene latifolia]|uniref:uncharacterized protein LOC141648843 n=1 Tax=Silene latifolia TaxID=37657 RepID=UPI003D782416